MTLFFGLSGAHMAPFACELAGCFSQLAGCIARQLAPAAHAARAAGMWPQTTPAPS